MGDINNDSLEKKAQAERMARNCASIFPTAKLISTADMKELWAKKGIQKIHPDQPVGNKSSNITLPGDDIACGAVLVDVRSEAEMSVSMIPGAIKLAEFEHIIRQPGAQQDRLKTKCTIIPYCTIGYRSGQYGEKLIRAGFQHVRNGEGIILWTYDDSLDSVQTKTGINDSNNLTVVPERYNPSQPLHQPQQQQHQLVKPTDTPGVFEKTDKVHVFSERFNLASDQYKPITFTPFEAAWEGIASYWRNW